MTRTADLLGRQWRASAQQRGVPHLFVVPALFLTFLFGPAGLLFYLAIRRFAPRPSRPPLPLAL